MTTDSDSGQGAPGGRGGEGGEGGEGEPRGAGGKGGAGGEGGAGGSGRAAAPVLPPPITRRDLPTWLADFVEEHPLFVRLYVPVMVTASVIVGIVTGRCSC